MITFLSQPEIIQPVYSNLVFQFQSTAATDPSLYRYRYVVNIFTQDGLISELKITPSSQGWGQCDISPILMNYTSSRPVNMGCSGDTPIHLANWGYLENNMIVYDIMVGEEYATTSTGSVIQYDGNGATGAPGIRSKVCYANNGVKEWFNGKSYDYTPFYLTGQTGTFPQYTSRFLTNSPRTRYIREGDYALLAATNWYNATGFYTEGIWGNSFNIDGNLPSQRVRAAKFKFYDTNNNLISTQRTYNVFSGCGTEANCYVQDYQYNIPLPANWAERQVIYLGVGTPNMEEAGITLPATTKYYSVELESLGVVSNFPPNIQYDDFQGCSCWDYQYYNQSIGSVNIQYYDCFGDYNSIDIAPDTIAQFCACQNSVLVNGTYNFDAALSAISECDVCICKTYSITNSAPETIFSYTALDCNGGEISGTIDPDTTIQICACEGSVAAFDCFIALLGDCPLPFSATCRTFGVSSNVEYVLPITYTGCCGQLLTINLPPLVSVPLCANSPFPESVLWDAVELSICSASPCPTPTPIPEPPTLPSGQPIICRNLCNDEIMYFSYSGETIAIGDYVNFQNAVYEIIEIGGGGFLPLVYPWVFKTEVQALSAFPCYTATTGTCQTMFVCSEPFYFYYDENCSPGNRVVFFLNKLGAWDSYNFRAREDEGWSVEKQVIQKSPELYSAGWDTPSYDGWNSRRDVWAQNVVQSGVLYTDFMPQAESLWLSEELTQSPSVYLVGDNGVLQPIVITNTEVVKPNYQINNSKYQIQIEYKSSYDTIRQNHE
jgi:hypothetical protein